MKKRIRKFCGDRRGATAIEYGLIVALVVIAAMGSIAAMGGGTHGMWQNTTDRVSAVIQ